MVCRSGNAEFLNVRNNNQIMNQPRNTLSGYPATSYGQLFDGTAASPGTNPPQLIQMPVRPMYQSV